MSKHDENQEEMLSFDALKKQVSEEDSDFTEDEEVQELLSSLRDIPEPVSAEENISESAEDTETPSAAPQEDAAQQYKSIYDDVLRAVSERKPEEEEVTGRRSKFMADRGQFVDVTEHYQDYADLTPQSVQEEPQAETAESETAEAVSAADEPEKQYRTFNEIFKDTFLKIFPNRHDSVGEGIRKTVVNL